MGLCTWGGSAYMFAACTSETGIGAVAGSVAGSLCFAGAGLVHYFMDDGNSAMKETQVYRQQHKLDTNF